MSPIVALCICFVSKIDFRGMRGEKIDMHQKGGYNRGSPPHARGKEKHARNRRSLLRITPACAGKSR